MYKNETYHDIISIGERNELAHPAPVLCNHQSLVLAVSMPIFCAMYICLVIYVRGNSQLHFCAYVMSHNIDVT